MDCSRNGCASSSLLVLPALYLLRRLLSQMAINRQMSNSKLAHPFLEQSIYCEGLKSPGVSMLFLIPKYSALCLSRKKSLLVFQDVGKTLSSVKHFLPAPGEQVAPALGSKAFCIHISWNLPLRNMTVCNRFCWPIWFLFPFQFLMPGSVPVTSSMSGYGLPRICCQCKGHGFVPGPGKFHN